VLACSALTYHFVESPMQRVGHRSARLLQARFGPDAITESVPVPDAAAVPAEAEANAEAAGDPMRESPQNHTGPQRPAGSHGPAGPHGHASFHGQAGPVPRDARRIT
jgi:hypothetical protein